MKHRPSQQTLIEHTIKSKIKTKSKRIPVKSTRMKIRTHFIGSVITFSKN